MAKTDLTTNSYHSLNTLNQSIQAFVRFAPLLLVLADRLESDFTAMRNDAIRLWQEPEEKDDE